MSNVSPNPSDRDLVLAVIAGKLTPEKAAELFRGNDQKTCKGLLLEYLAKQSLDVRAAALLLDRLEKLAAPSRRMYCKVSLKGGMSLYGLQRMPVTLYVEQWHALLDFSDGIRDFMGEHDSELKRKGPGDGKAAMTPAATAA